MKGQINSWVFLVTILCSTTSKTVHCYGNGGRQHLPINQFGSNQQQFPSVANLPLANSPVYGGVSGYRGQNVVRPVSPGVQNVYAAGPVPLGQYQSSLGAQYGFQQAPLVNNNFGLRPAPTWTPNRIPAASSGPVYHQPSIQPAVTSYAGNQQFQTVNSPLTQYNSGLLLRQNSGLQQQLVSNQFAPQYVQGSQQYVVQNSLRQPTQTIPTNFIRNPTQQFVSVQSYPNQFASLYAYQTANPSFVRNNNVQYVNNPSLINQAQLNQAQLQQAQLQKAQLQQAQLQQAQLNQAQLQQAQLNQAQLQQAQLLRLQNLQLQQSLYGQQRLTRPVGTASQLSFRPSPQLPSGTVFDGSQSLTESSFVPVSAANADTQPWTAVSDDEEVKAAPVDSVVTSPPATKKPKGKALVIKADPDEKPPAKKATAAPKTTTKKPKATTTKKPASTTTEAILVEILAPQTNAVVDSIESPQVTAAEAVEPVIIQTAQEASASSTSTDQLIDGKAAEAGASVASEPLVLAVEDPAFLDLLKDTSSEKPSAAE